MRMEKLKSNKTCEVLPMSHCSHVVIQFRGTYFTCILHVEYNTVLIKNMKSEITQKKGYEQRMLTKTSYRMLV
jgi:hypothetical protein